VSLVNTTIRDIDATSKIIIAVSSTIELYKVNMTNIKVSMTVPIYPNYQAAINNDKKSLDFKDLSEYFPEPLATSNSGDIMLVANTLPPKDITGTINNVFLPPAD
jgi:hypothetical protein